MNESDPRGEVTRLLLELGTDALGRDDPSQRLIDLVYSEMHEVASRLLARERPGHTLQPTALVNEAYLRLVDQTRTNYQSRVHFLRLAARTMRRILVDHARRSAASKRGGGLQRVEWADDAAGNDSSALEVLALDRELARFGETDPRAAQVVELRVFGGLKVDEIASALGVSKRTVDQDWAVARLWLARAFAEEGP